MKFEANWDKIQIIGGEMDYDNFRAPLTIVAYLYGQDITADILDNDVA